MKDIDQAVRRPDSLVFILAGQSNMEGYGEIQKLPTALRNLPSRVRLYDHGKFGVLPECGRFGPEASFSRRIARAFPRQTILLLKYAVGGTSLLAWAPQWSAEKAQLTGNQWNGPLYRQLLEFAADTLGHPLRADGFLWMQGERDSRFPNVAEHYGANFSELICCLRRDFDAPKAPFVFGLVNPPAERYEGIAEVRKAQLSTAERLPQVRCVSTTGLSKLDDALHYDSEGQVELGKRMASTMISLLRGSF